MTIDITSVHSRTPFTQPNHLTGIVLHEHWNQLLDDATIWISAKLCQAAEAELRKTGWPSTDPRLRLAPNC